MAYAAVCRKKDSRQVNLDTTESHPDLFNWQLHGSLFVDGPHLPPTATQEASVFEGGATQCQHVQAETSGRTRPAFRRRPRRVGQLPPRLLQQRGPQMQHEEIFDPALLPQGKHLPEAALETAPAAHPIDRAPHGAGHGGARPSTRRGGCHRRRRPNVAQDGSGRHSGLIRDAFCFSKILKAVFLRYGCYMPRF